MTALLPTILVVLMAIALITFGNSVSTKDQTIAYGCGYNAGLQHGRTEKEERDYCKSIRLQAVKDGLKAVANP
jgi:hypothetical protein